MKSQIFNDSPLKSVEHFPGDVATSSESHQFVARHTDTNSKALVS